MSAPLQLKEFRSSGNVPDAHQPSWLCPWCTIPPPGHDRSHPASCKQTRNLMRQREKPSSCSTRQPAMLPWTGRCSPARLSPRRQAQARSSSPTRPTHSLRKVAAVDVRERDCMVRGGKARTRSSNSAVGHGRSQHTGVRLKLVHPDEVIHEEAVADIVHTRTNYWET